MKPSRMIKSAHAQARKAGYKGSLKKATQRKPTSNNRAATGHAGVHKVAK